MLAPRRIHGENQATDRHVGSGTGSQAGL